MCLCLCWPPCVCGCRAPDGSPGRRFKTNLWLKAMNLAENLPRNRYVLGYEVLGFQVRRGH